MIQKKPPKNKTFGRLSLITLIAVYFLIFVGGVVRSTGSGMGCPDWPKCFGQWIPPINAKQLPDDYKQKFVAERAGKNMKLASYLETLGMSAKAEAIRNDHTILAETEFNPAKTWTEYVNRLLGAAIGLLIIATFIASLNLIKSDPRVVVTSFLALALVIFQGWLGSLVVSTNLLPWMVTVHMIMALIIVAVLMYNVFRSRSYLALPQLDSRNLINGLLVLCMGTMLIQIAMGTQVREMVDTVAASLNFRNRNTWIANLGLEFYVHRSFSLLILGLHIVLIYVIRQRIDQSSLYYQISRILVILVIMEIITGAAMAYFGIPAFLQPLHLLLASIVFGIQFLFFLELNFKTKHQVAFGDH